MDMSAMMMGGAGQAADLKNLYVVFYVDGEAYALDIGQVREINSEFQVTPVPHAPYPVEGYVNLRGQIHLIVNIKRYFQLMENPEHDWSSEPIEFIQENRGMDLSGFSDRRRRGESQEVVSKNNPINFETGPQMIIFKESVSAPSGIIVNEIGDIISVPPSRVEEFVQKDSVGAGSGGDAGEKGIFQKVLKLEDDLIIGISARKLMDSIEFIL